MVSSVIQAQFARVLQDFPGATMAEQPDGTIHVEARNIQVPPGWNKPATSILVILPVTFPEARPNGFYADPDLNLAGGGVGGEQQVIAGRHWRYFCWQVQA